MLGMERSNRSITYAVHKFSTGWDSSNVYQEHGVIYLSEPQIDNCNIEEYLVNKELSAMTSKIAY